MPDRTRVAQEDDSHLDNTAAEESKQGDRCDTKPTLQECIEFFRSLVQPPRLNHNIPAWPMSRLFDGDLTDLPNDLEIMALMNAYTTLHPLGPRLRRAEFGRNTHDTGKRAIAWDNQRHTYVINVAVPRRRLPAHYVYYVAEPETVCNGSHPWRVDRNLPAGTYLTRAGEFTRNSNGHPNLVMCETCSSVFYCDTLIISDLMRTGAIIQRCLRKLGIHNVRAPSGVPHLEPPLPSHELARLQSDRMLENLAGTERELAEIVRDDLETTQRASVHNSRRNVDDPAVDRAASGDDTETEVSVV